MRNNEITITLVDGQNHEKQFEFDAPQICVFGRASDCDIAPPDSDESLLISRHHCLLEIDPPAVRIHDLGSTNGTYVNGVKIRSDQQKARQGPHAKGVRLYDGDEVKAGPVVLRVHTPVRVSEPTLADFNLEFADDMMPAEAIDQTTIGGRLPRD